MDELSSIAPDNAHESDRIGLHLGYLTPQVPLSLFRGAYILSNSRLVTSAALI
jgi:hypothetical protein